MKHQWLVYVIVGVLSIGAGVAIAGLPDNADVDPTVLPPASIEAPASSTTDPSTTAADTTDPATTVPDTSDPESTDPGTTAPDSTQPDSTIPDTSEAPTTSEPPETTDPEPLLPDRSEIVTVTANGANVAGTATRWSELLESLGYADVQPRDGTVVVDLSVIPSADGFEESAVRLAEDMLRLPEFVAPLAEAPRVLDLPDDVELLAYVGLDRA